MISWLITELVHLWNWMTSTFTIQNLFAFFALVISLHTAFRNRTFFKVKWGNDCEITMNNSIVAKKKDGTPDISYTDTFLTYLTVVNPSPNDIAYYDLKAYDLDNDKPLEILFAIYFYLDDKQTYFVHYTNLLNMNLLELPVKSHGVFAANSYTRFNLPIIVTDEYEYKNLKHIKIEFKVAKSSSRKAKVCSKLYNVSEWQNASYKVGYGQDIKINILTKEIIALEVKDHITDNKKLLNNIRQIYQILKQINETKPVRAISLITLKEICDVPRFIIEKKVKHDLTLVKQLKSIQEELKNNRIVNDVNSREYLNKLKHDIDHINKIFY